MIVSRGCADFDGHQHRNAPTSFLALLRSWQQPKRISKRHSYSIRLARQPMTSASMALLVERFYHTSAALRQGEGIA